MIEYEKFSLKSIRLYKGSSGIGGGGGGGAISKKANGILNPTTKEDFINRAEFIAEVSENGAYTYEMFTSDWSNYGKDRTYIKIAEKYVDDGKTRNILDMGYYDNNSNTYVPGRSRGRDLGEENVWKISRNESFELDDIIKILKKKK